MPACRAESGREAPALAALADLEKKLMMERWLLPDGVLAGVRTGVERLSPMVNAR